MVALLRHPHLDPDKGHWPNFLVSAVRPHWRRLLGLLLYWAQMAIEMEDSLWFRQVTKRVQRLIARVEALA